MYFEFPRRSHFRGEAIFQKTLLPLPCKECSKLFSESGSLKTHLTLIQEKSHLLLNNFPNHFHKRKSVVPFKDSKNSNLISTFSLLRHFCHCPFLSSNMSLSMFWLLRRSLTMILQRIFEWRKESCWVVSLISNSSFTLEDIIKMEPIAKFTYSPLIVNMCVLTLSRLGHFGP